MKKHLQLVVLTSVCILLAAGALAAITYEYDRLHRLVRVTYDDGAVIVYEYDAVGNRILRVTNTDPNTVYLAVHVSPPGWNPVTRDPDLTWYPLNTQVTLTAHVWPGSFGGWTGDVPPGQQYTNPLLLIMDDYKSVTLYVLVRAGDLNCDGTVDFGDINPFVLYLSNFPAWQAAYPECPAENGDINGDGDYPSFGDINPFVALLAGA